jgi:hypothetical protein
MKLAIRDAKYIRHNALTLSHGPQATAPLAGATRPVFFESVFSSARLPVVSGCAAGARLSSERYAPQTIPPGILQDFAPIHPLVLAAIRSQIAFPGLPEEGGSNGHFFQDQV